MLHSSDVTILFGAALVLCAYLYLTRHFNYWKIRKIPHKRPAVLFGNLYDVVTGKETIGRHLANLYHEFKGPYFGFFGIDEPILVIRDTHIIKRILVTDFQVFSEKAFLNDESIDPIFSKVLFTQKYPQWINLRAKLSPIFTTGNIKMMLPLIHDCVKSMSEYIQLNKGKTIDTKRMSDRYSTDVIASCAFGIQLKTFLNDNCDFVKAGEKQFARAIQPLAYVFAHPLVKLFKLKFIDGSCANYFRDIFTKALKERERNKIHRNDVLDTLKVLKDQNIGGTNFKLTGDALVAQAIIFYVAGVDAISNILSLVFLELAIHTDIQNQLRKEIQDILGKHGLLTYDAIQDMKYLDMVMSETFRKYPFTAFTHRRCTEDYIIPETGFLVERGMKVLVPVQGLTRDPQYFPEPDRFDPERFSEANRSKIVECSFLPFSIGPRKCIGSRFAMLTLQLSVSHLLTQYTIEKAPTTIYPLQFGNSFFRQPLGGIPLIFKPI